MPAKCLCFSCQKEMTFSDAKISLREECSHCGADAHVCKNCQFFDANAYNECREPVADRVKEKERNNHCDYFVLNQDGKAQIDKAAQLKAAAEALFKKN